MRVQIPEKFKPLFKPKRYKIFYGGRGAAKSWAFAQAGVIKASQEKKRILCARQLQGSIKDSVLKLLSDTIDRLELTNRFEVQGNAIIGANKSDFLFKGLWNNTTSIKSTEDVGICWVEEAEDVTNGSWDTLIPTIRSPGSEIWVSFNPKHEQDDTYQRFIAPYLKHLDKYGFYEDDMVYVCKVNYTDNPWFAGTELEKEMLRDKENNYRRYLHVWEGNPVADYGDAIIEPEWVEAAIDGHKKLGYESTGLKVTGFDVADSGKDAKAVINRFGSLVTKVDMWLEGDIDDAIPRAFNHAYEHKSDFLVYDSVGVGAGVKVGLKQRIAGRDIAVHGFSGGAGVTDPKAKYKDDKYNQDQFRNLRAQYWWYLRDRFYTTYLAVVKGQYHNPDDMIFLPSDLEYLPILKDELCRVQRKRYNTDKLQVESKKDMIARKMKSPNLADALVYCFGNPPLEEDVVTKPKSRSQWSRR
jgi:phage terminase large subunit